MGVCSYKYKARPDESTYGRMGLGAVRNAETPRLKNVSIENSGGGKTLTFSLRKTVRIRAKIYNLQHKAMVSLSLQMWREL
jgi:hypothetical protein